MEADINGAKLELVSGDITLQQVDAIVNAANASLAGGGGVDGAIHKAGGPAIMDQTSREYPGGCPTGSAVITSAGELSAKYVIHAVGPRYRDGTRGERDLLIGAYQASLQLAVDNDCPSVALPALSMGAYGYPHDEASRVALQAAIDFLSTYGRPALVRFVLFGQPTFELFQSTLRELSSAE